MNEFFELLRPHVVLQGGDTVQGALSVSTNFADKAAIRIIGYVDCPKSMILSQSPLPTVISRFMNPPRPHVVVLQGGGTVQGAVSLRTNRTT